MATAFPCNKSANEVAAAFMQIAHDEVVLKTRLDRRLDESRCWDVASDEAMKLLPLALKDDILQKFARWRIRRALNRELKRGRLNYGSETCELSPEIGGGDSSSGDIDVMDLLQRCLTEEEIEFLLYAEISGDRERKRLSRIRLRLKEALMPD
jgi:hypothetical protein